ncbi:TNF receptor-associated factor 2 isoform X2 [Piliocolobus tephrosceles]|uniref:TNF receptor-associated factor 2 isoform X2 n=1 Tax=Piliocolobus tephrosceles TaxID=591936 RepID=UPI000C297720|nr:TNF receptor-associated factor 2 isoform X2 [Piliocolobus tephrosceles]
MRVPTCRLEPPWVLSAHLRCTRPARHDHFLAAVSLPPSHTEKGSTLTQRLSPSPPPPAGTRAPPLASHFTFRLTEISSALKWFLHTWTPHPPSRHCPVHVVLISHWDPGSGAYGAPVLFRSGVFTIGNQSQLFLTASHSERPAPVIFPPLGYRLCPARWPELPWACPLVPTPGTWTLAQWPGAWVSPGGPPCSTPADSAPLSPAPHVSVSCPSCPVQQEPLEIRTLEEYWAQRWPPAEVEGEKQQEHEAQWLREHLAMLLSSVLEAKPLLGDQSHAGSELLQRCENLEKKTATFENIVCVLNREVERVAMTAEACSRQHRLDQDKIEALSNKVQQLERSIGLKDLAMADLEQKVLEMEASTYDGVFIWKISDFARKRQEAVAGRTPAIFSPAFYTSRYGYKMCLRIYLNGDGTGRGTHLSLFFVVMKGPNDALLRWPFNQKVTLMLLDQNNREHVIDAFRPDVTSSSFQRPVNDMNIASGCPLFCPVSKMEAKNSYVRDDAIFIKAIVDLTGL